MEELAVTIDLGATKTRTALVDKKGKILERREIETSKKDVIKDVVSETKKVLRNHSILGIGISATGPIDLKKGKTYPTNLDFEEISLRESLKKEFGLPVYLYNDATAAVCGEKHFGEERNNMVYLTISTGIGAGVIVDGHLLLGKDGNAAEVGHFIVDSKYNFPCGCKKGKGHWEGYCSGKNIVRFFNYWLSLNNIKKDYKVKEAKDIFQLEDKEFIKEINEINGRGVSNVITAYSPELIIIGGSVFLENEEVLLSGIKNNVEQFLPLPEIKATSLGEDISLLGAAAIVLWPPNEK